jgi:hypothetical protein
MCGALIGDPYFPSSRYDGIGWKIIIKCIYINMKLNECHVEKNKNKLSFNQIKHQIHSL